MEKQRAWGILGREKDNERDMCGVICRAVARDWRLKV